MKKSLLSLVIVIASNCALFAQVGVGTLTPDGSSALDITSTSGGLLVPRMSTSQRDAIATPANGLMVFNTSSNGFEVFKSSCGCWSLVNDQSMAISISSSDDVPEGSTNLYYTNARVSANPDVVANTAKQGYTDAKVSANPDVVANTAKASYTDAPTSQGNRTSFNLGNAGGDRYVQSANNGTNYTVNIIGSKVGAWAKLLINAASEPTVNGSNAGKVKGATFLSNTDMYMVIFTDDGTNINYFFLDK